MEIKTSMEKECLLTIYDCHTSNNSKLYRSVCSSIIDDMLMGKYDKDGRLRKLNDEVKLLIEDYYTLANEFYEKYHFCKCEDLEYYTVYRGSSTEQRSNERSNDRSNTIIAHIPFSTSIEPENAENWINYKTKCCLWVIRVPVDTKFLCIDNPNEGKEIILPAGKLIIENINEKNSIKMFECLFKPDI